MQIIAVFILCLIMFPLQCMIAIPVYKACKNKGLQPTKWTVLTLIPYIGFAVTVHILAQKDL